MPPGRGGAPRGLPAGPALVSWRQQQHLQELASAVWEMPGRDTLAAHIRARLDVILRSLRPVSPLLDSAAQLRTDAADEAKAAAHDGCSPDVYRSSMIQDERFANPGAGYVEQDSASVTSGGNGSGGSSSDAEGVSSDRGEDDGGAEAEEQYRVQWMCFHLQVLLAEVTTLPKPAKASEGAGSNTLRSARAAYSLAAAQPPRQGAWHALGQDQGVVGTCGSLAPGTLSPTAHFAASYLHALLFLSWQPVRQLPGSFLDDLAAPSEWLLPTPWFAAAVEALGAEHLVPELLSLGVLGEGRDETRAPQQGQGQGQAQRQGQEPGHDLSALLLSQLLDARPSLAVGMLASLYPTLFNQGPAKFGWSAAMLAMLIAALRRSCEERSASAATAGAVAGALSAPGAGVGLEAAEAARHLRCLVAVAQAAWHCLEPEAQDEPCTTTLSAAASSVGQGESAQLSLQPVGNCLYCLEVLLCEWQDSILQPWRSIGSGPWEAEAAQLLGRLLQLLPELQSSLDRWRQQQLQQPQQPQQKALDFMQVVRFKCRVLLFTGAAPKAPAPIAAAPVASPALPADSNPLNRPPGKDGGAARLGDAGGDCEGAGLAWPWLWVGGANFRGADQVGQRSVAAPLGQVSARGVQELVGDAFLQEVCGDPFRIEAWGAAAASTDTSLQQQRQGQQGQAGVGAQGRDGMGAGGGLEMASLPPTISTWMQLPRSSLGSTAGPESAAITARLGAAVAAALAAEVGEAAPGSRSGNASAYFRDRTLSLGPGGTSALVPVWALPLPRAAPKPLGAGADAGMAPSVAAAWAQRLAGLMMAMLTPGLPSWWACLQYPAVQACLGADPYCPVSCTLCALELAAGLVSEPEGSVVTAPWGCVGVCVAGVHRRSLVVLLLHMGAGAASQARRGRQQEALVEAVGSCSRLQGLLTLCSQDPTITASASRLVILCLNRMISQFEFERTGGIALSASAARDTAAAEAAALLSVALLAPGVLLRRMVRDGIRHSGQQPVVLELLKLLWGVVRGRHVSALMLPWSNKEGSLGDGEPGALMAGWAGERAAAGADAAGAAAGADAAGAAAGVDAGRRGYGEGGIGVTEVATPLCVALREHLLPTHQPDGREPTEGSGRPLQEQQQQPLTDSERAALLQLCASVSECGLASEREQLVGGALPVLAARLEGRTGRTQAIAALMWAHQAVRLPPIPSAAAAAAATTTPPLPTHSTLAASSAAATQPLPAGGGNVLLSFTASAAGVAEGSVASVPSHSLALVHSAGVGAFAMLLGQLLSSYQREVEDQGVLDGAGLDACQELVGWVAWAAREGALLRWGALRQALSSREGRRRVEGLTWASFAREEHGVQEEEDEEEEGEEDDEEEEDGNVLQACVSASIPATRHGPDTVPTASTPSSAVAAAIVMGGDPLVAAGLSVEQQAVQLLCLAREAAEKLPRHALLPLLPALEVGLALLPTSRVARAAREALLQKLLPRDLWTGGPGAGGRARRGGAGGLGGEEARVAARRVAALLEWCAAGEWQCRMWEEAVVGSEDEGPGRARDGGAGKGASGAALGVGAQGAAPQAPELDALARGVVGGMRRVLLPEGSRGQQAREDALQAVSLALAEVLPVVSPRAGSLLVLGSALPVLVWGCGVNEEEEEEGSDDGGGGQGTVWAISPSSRWLEEWGSRPVASPQRSNRGQERGKGQRQGQSLPVWGEQTWWDAAAHTRHQLCAALLPSMQVVRGQPGLRIEGEGEQVHKAPSAPSVTAHCLHLGFLATQRALAARPGGGPRAEGSISGEGSEGASGLAERLQGSGSAQAAADRCFAAVAGYVQGVLLPGACGDGDSSTASAAGQGGVQGQAVQAGNGNAGGMPRAGLMEVRRLALALVALEEGVVCLDRVAAPPQGTTRGPAGSAARGSAYDCNTLQVLLLSLVRTLCTPTLQASPASSTPPGPMLACGHIPYLGLLFLVSGALRSIERCPSLRGQLQTAALQVTEDHLVAAAVPDCDQLMELAETLFGDD